ncbi:hypothetical protein [Nocardioides sp. TF02-7]|uniref:hypothetical protein n=1 Tax=Nocardioides sp. TF02-7 TaxID=2917724 RepID=UPI001F06E123|nr:hypothetical protein [Nocardioides sp. TF02-7]UMG93368.1 hypothetical protein MF408_03620 [Nocardioides sp. TF02-7]
MHMKIAGKLTGRVTKWIVLVVALVAAGGMSTLNAKLIDVQENEASAWLPESAESTKVLEELSGTVDPNDIPTLVVYHRDGGLTEADLAAMDEHAREIAGTDGVTDEGVLTPQRRRGGREPAAAGLGRRRGRLPPLHLELRRRRLERGPRRRGAGP